MIALGSLTACGLVLGIEDPQPLPATPPDAALEAEVDATAGGDAQARAVDPTQIFVSARTGNAESTCGSMAAPCRTIGDALARYREANGAKTTVYVASGSYAESVVLADGVTIEGGWDVVFDAWVPSEGTRAVIAPPTDARAVVADDLKVAATVRLLTLRSKVAGPSESLYGVFAHGTDASAKPMLRLDQITIELGAGGDGDAGMPETDAGAAGTSGCAPDEDGGAGSPGTTGRGADAGEVTATGYTTANGDTGGTGGSGHTGRTGDPGMLQNCTVCCSNGGFCGGSCSGAGCTYQQGSGYGVGGAPGCGGGGGRGGGGGGGGGGSIGVFAWGGDVVVIDTRIVAGAGGRGGEGGAGARGGDGGLGLEGTVGLCTYDEIKCSTASTPLEGLPGDNGGPGGMGGTGGSGAGGPSCAIYTGPATNVTVTASTLIHGLGGASTNGAPGIAGDVCP